MIEEAKRQDRLQSGFKRYDSGEGEFSSRRRAMTMAIRAWRDEN